MNQSPEQAVEPIYRGGFVAGLLTARYYALRDTLNGEAFQRGAPSEMPAVVYRILEHLPRAVVDHYLFSVGWRSLDYLLLCDSTEQLEAALTTMPGSSFH